jgi:ribosomal protein S12 methylthiotransferase accessory factor YcaO
VTRLKLRDDAYHAPTSEGICILTNGGEAVLTGPSIFQWVDRLVPYLDGTHTLAELTASMPAGRRDMTERVVTTLRERGVVVEVAEDENGGDLLTSGERLRYRREIDFLGYFGPSAQRCFHAYRESAVVLVGAGRMLVETVEAVLCSGSRRLRVAVMGDDPADAALLAGCERRARLRDPRQRVTHAAVDLTDEEQLSGVAAGAGIVLYASDSAAVDQVRALDRTCARAGVPFASVILAGDEAWLGPFGPVPGQGPGWMSWWRRLLALDDTGGGRSRRPASGQDGPAAPHGGLWAGAARTVVANQFAREVVRLRSGTAEQTSGARMVRVDLLTLRTGRHGFLPHPFALPAGAGDRASLLATVGRLGQAEPLSAEEFSQRVAACVQPRLGVLGEVTERDFAQIPLAVSQVQVSDPVLLLGPGVPLPVVTGAGPSHDDARRAAALRGLAAYGSLMVDPRRLHARDGASATGDPEEDLAALAAGRWDGFVWGYGLADGRPHELAAAEVFPALRGVRSRYAPPAGAAAGYGWHQAIRNGLLDQCRRLTVSQITRRRRPFAPIAWTEAAMDARGGRYRSMVQTAGGKLDVYDATGAPGVPTLAFCLDGVTVAYTCGFSYGEALRDGLADVLLWHQARANREPGYAPPPVPPLPPRERLPRLIGCPAWSTNEAATAARLAQLGWTAVAVPLDHDPGVTASIMPHLVNVVLTRA